MAKQFLFERSKNIYYREKDGDKDLLYKVLRNEHPDGYTLASFQNEYTILEGLSIPGVRKAIRIDRLDGLYAIVLEYLEGESLNEYLDRNKLEIKELLELFIFMTRILLDVNAAGIIHRDIKPSNFIYNEEKQILTLIDFEIATKLDIHSSFVNDNSKYFEGSLPFMSPEQTGRINRKVDHRSDLYSLGITFYTLLSGSPPFISQDPLEIIHSHIAKVPKAIHLINNSVPKAISNILSRLLEKEKENRYQSFLGLLTDLEICYKQLQETNEIKNFEIAQNDKTVLLSIPEKLYGRENELEILLKSFESSLKKKQLVLIGGLSGIGKTALIRELYKSITLKKG